MTDRVALGAFLRARREAVGPGDVGLPDGPGRRTPGLRRSELAALAGVSIEYLTRLERGHAHRPSMEVVAALASALRLGEDEHVHLIRLVKATGGGGSGCEPTDRTVRPGVLAVLDRLDDGPALVVDRCGDVLARTVGTALLGLPDVANLPRFVVTDPRAAMLPDRATLVDEWAARLRAAADLGDARAAALATELAEDPGSGFGPRYAAPPRVPAWSGTERWSGNRTWAYEAFEIPGTPEHRLLVYVPT